MFIGSEMK